jgi:hypothetical protein
MKTYLKIFIPILAVSLFIILAISAAKSTSSHIVSGVTGNKIKSIKLGMDMDEVIKILGRPYQIEALRGTHNITCKHPKKNLYRAPYPGENIKKTISDIYNDTQYCCDGNKDDYNYKTSTFTYSKHMFLCKYYPMLHVDFDEENKVSGIFASRYEGFWGEPESDIYCCYWADLYSSIKSKHDSIIFHIDEIKLNECFN